VPWWYYVAWGYDRAYIYNLYSPHCGYILHTPTPSHWQNHHHYTKVIEYRQRIGGHPVHYTNGKLRSKQYRHPGMHQPPSHHSDGRDMRHMQGHRPDNRGQHHQDMSRGNPGMHPGGQGHGNQPAPQMRQGHHGHQGGQGRPAPSPKHIAPAKRVK
jgi:hypothetical protein